MLVPPVLALWAPQGYVWVCVNVLYMINCRVEVASRLIGCLKELID